MKTHILFATTALTAGALLSGCSGTKQASTGQTYDDVYFAADKPAEVQQDATKPSDYTAAQPAATDENSRFEYQGQEPQSGTESRGAGYVNNNYYYDNDDYYDYAYSARLRRFYRPYGWGYYDSFYTNPYWYDYNPSGWGTSIYLGYNWWAPSYMYYSPFTWGISFNYGWGWPSYGWCGNYWNTWYSPYGNHQYWHHPYAYGYGYPGYWGGYHNGYWNGYYDGLYSHHNPYYFNYYDYNSYSNYYYGPRPGGSGQSTASSAPRPSVAQLYQATLPEKYSSPVISTVASEAAPVRAGTLEAAPAGAAQDKGVRQDKAPARPDQYTPRQDAESKPVRSNQAETPQQPVRSNDKANEPVRTNQPQIEQPVRNEQPVRQEPQVRPSRNNPEQPEKQRQNEQLQKPRSNNEPPQQEMPSRIDTQDPGKSERPEIRHMEALDHKNDNYYKEPVRAKEVPRQDYEKPRNNYEPPKQQRTVTTPKSSGSRKSSTRESSQPDSGSRKRR